MKAVGMYHMDEQRSHPRSETVQQMIRIAQPEAVYLLGASRRSRRSESIFCPDAPTSSYLSDHFYLVLLPDDRGKTNAQWEDQLEHSIPGLPFTVLAMDAGRFVSWLHAGHAFACRVQERAPLLYKVDGYPTTAVPCAQSTETMAAQEKEHALAMQRSRQFMAGAALYQVRTEYAMAAFMLHQAAEQALRALLQAGTGYFANLHNVERLLRYASLVSWQLPDVFNTALPADKQLLQLLQKAYIGARYEKGYTVRAEELMRLQRKVQMLVDIAMKTGLECIRKEVVSFVEPTWPDSI